MKDKEYEVTKHAKNRISKRMGIPKRAVQRQFELALERGYRQRDMKGHLRKWATKEALKNELNPHEIIVYNNFCWILSGSGKLITVFSIPANIANNINDYVRKDRIKKTND